MCMAYAQKCGSESHYELTGVTIGSWGGDVVFYFLQMGYCQWPEQCTHLVHCVCAIFCYVMVTPRSHCELNVYYDKNNRNVCIINISHTES